jgi:hypothetical protein
MEKGTCPFPLGKAHQETALGVYDAAAGHLVETHLDRLFGPLANGLRQALNQQVFPDTAPSSCVQPVTSSP